jgi:hypothetical protein
VPPQTAKTTSRKGRRKGRREHGKEGASEGGRGDLQSLYGALQEGVDEFSIGHDPKGVFHQV